MVPGTYSDYEREHPSKVVRSPLGSRPSAAEDKANSQDHLVIIEECPSYSQLEGHIFGRQSFGGFNQVVENNVKNGIWRPFHLDPYSGTGEVKEDGQLSEEDGEKDVSDEEMAKTYGSLVGTLGKRFKKKNNLKNERKKKLKGAKKRRRNEDDDVEVIEDNVDESVAVAAGGGDKNRGKVKKGWKNYFKGNSKGSYDVNKGAKKNKRKETDDAGSIGEQQSPRKKMRFMKPSDD